MADGENDLFRRAMWNVKPLKNSTSRAKTQKAPPKGAALKQASPQKQAVRMRRSVLPASKPKPKRPLLGHGDITGLDRRTGQRFKRGQLPLEARLDLHGMTQTEAHRALSSFLAVQQSAGRRCVIVVTGKGVGKEGGGVLRNAVPFWLNEAPNRNRVLAFEYARQKDGGAGAIYVLLRRRRAGLGI